MVLKLNYTEYSYQQLMTQVLNRFEQDEIYKEFTGSSLFRMIAETFSAMTEMLMYYIERRAEETYTRTAKLDSSAILLSQDLGYVVKRAIPAQAKVICHLEGALPDKVTAGTEIVFDRNNLVLAAGGSKFVFAKSFTYKLTEKDLLNPTKLNVFFETVMAVNADNSISEEPICVVGGEFVEQKFPGKPTKFQTYKINDLNFSNWYGSEDPGEGSYSYCQVWISSNGNKWSDSSDDIRKFKVHRSFKIIDPSVNNCVIETGLDKLPVIRFGDGNTWSGGVEREVEDTQGVSSGNQWVHIRYLKTDGYGGNFHQKGEGLTKTGDLLINGIPVPSLKASFSFAGSSFGGADMEDGKRILQNSPYEFSRFERLVVDSDYVSFLKSLTSPFIVNHAMVWTESKEIEDLRAYTGEDVIAVRDFSNALVFSICGNVYDGENLKINFSGKGNNAVTLWTDESNDYYDSSLGGWHYYQMMNDTQSYNAEILEDETVKSVINLLKENALISCVEHRPISPIIHYFEAVGTVTLSPMADMQSVKSRTLQDLYAHLEKKGFRERIDKSEVEEIILSQPGVRAVSMRFTPMHDLNNKTFSVETGLLNLESLTNFLDTNPVYGTDSKRSVIRQIYQMIADWFASNRVFTVTDALRYATDDEFPAVYVNTLMRKDGPDIDPASYMSSNINERYFWTKIAVDIKGKNWFKNKKRLKSVLQEVHGGIQRYLTNSLIDAQGNISGFTMPNEIAAVCFNRPFALDPELLPGDYCLQWKYSY